MATTVTSSAASVCCDDSTLTMLVDSGATHNFVDPLLTPRLQDLMSDYCVLEAPHTASLPLVNTHFEVLRQVLFKAP